MAKAKLKLLKGGRQQIQDAATGFSSYQPVYFEVGSTANFVATELETAVRGTRVYTGSSDLIQRRRLSTDSTRFTLTIPEGIGPFEVGNILLWTTGQDGKATPFALVILPFVIVKRAANFEGVSLQLPNPGNRLLVNITIVHQVLESGEAGSVSVEVVAPDYANLAFYDNESSVPAPNLNPWKQFIVARLNLTDGPGLVTKVNDSAYWAMPFWRDLRHPQYHVLSGGVHGDHYRERPHTFIWGQRYRTPVEQFRAKTGGLGYTVSRANAGLRIGGLPYKG